ncbi:MAG: hypothetical protein M3376_06660, partial [Actinomycetota bacterium]|nr:hypothetical protein [Actinomycetota bacterium]
LPPPGQERRQAAADEKAAASGVSGDSPAWGRWSEAAQKRPWAAIALSLVILLGLALPALHMRLGTADAGLDPPDTTTRAAYDLIAEGFGAGTSGSFLLAVDLQRKGDTAAAQRVTDAVARDLGVTEVTPPQLSKDGEIATVVMFPKSGPREKATTRLLERLRGEVLPPSSGRAAPRCPSADRFPRRRTSRASSPTSCRCSSAWSCCSARCC